MEHRSHRMQSGVRTRRGLHRRTSARGGRHGSSSPSLVAIGKRSYAIYLWSYVLKWLRDTGFLSHSSSSASHSWPPRSRTALWNYRPPVQAPLHDGHMEGTRGRPIGREGLGHEVVKLQGCPVMLVWSDAGGAHTIETSTALGARGGPRGDQLGVDLGRGPGCLAGATLPDHTVPDWRGARTVDYCVEGGQSLPMTLFAPSTTEHPVPVILQVHGGGWQRGSRLLSLPQSGTAADLVGAGFMVASIDYRTAGESLARPDHRCKVRRPLSAVARGISGNRARPNRRHGIERRWSAREPARHYRGRAATVGHGPVRGRVSEVGAGSTVRTKRPRCNPWAVIHRGIIPLGLRRCSGRLIRSYDSQSASPMSPWATRRF